ncbi:MAG: hypothetical protein HN352_15770 [Bacteroidetes bacterium]|jgi:hypothetical protein|nr:hypothetical protein [Bacteroidota bacterium]MBT3748101.1 hypothetical protein [Bacteroidota bacterium]MBT4401538.1 hypothetical protein [Bacteroidota bacterium]MBT4410457.1 hypothetical protein [Bacteroidota bacterium]MBT5427958.1 hypothetical protein [Bacteroidota bacterium]
MFFRILITGLLTFCTCTISGYGQINEFRKWKHYALFQEDFSIDTLRKDQIFVHINNLNFLKNNEYKNDYIIGQTLVGMFLEPSVDYYPDKKTRIRAGVHLLKYHGRNSFDKIAPIISVQHHANEHIDLIVGTIQGAANHGLLEPIMSFEKNLINHNENGLQFLLSYPWIQADVWLNWEQFIKTDDPFQEKFTAGANAYIKIHEEDQWHFGLPVQLLFRHSGGQIDASNLPADTQNNSSFGLFLEWIPDLPYLKSVSLEHQLLLFQEVNPGVHKQIINGQGMYSLLDADTKYGQFQLGLWQGYNYFSPHGEPLFLSSSLISDDNYSAERSMLTIKYQYQKKLNDFLDIALRIEPYYHFNTRRMDHSWSVYLLLSKDFFLRGVR